MSRIAHHRPAYPDDSGMFRTSYHYEMVSDALRTGAIFEALKQTLRPDQVFCELGCGTGIFSLFAAGRCKRVFAMEIDPVMAEVARENFRRSNHGDRVEFIEGDAMTAELPVKADIIFAEMMSIWCIEEPQVVVFNRAHQDLLAPDGKLLPSRIVNLVELGYQDFRLGEIELATAIPLFTGIRHPASLTERRVFEVLDFSLPVDPELGGEIELEAIASGPINCAKLLSNVQMGPRSVFSGSDSLMPPTVVPLREQIEVRAGDRIRLSVSVRARSDLGDGIFVAEML